MDEIKEQEVPNNYAEFFLIGTLAALSLLRKGNYRAALLLYSRGGGGLNVYKIQPDGKLHRKFAIDYHPFWDKKSKQSEWKLHYHRGDTLNQIKKHRPYEGGW